MQYLIKWCDKSEGVRLCTEPTARDAFEFILEKSGDPCAVVWAFDEKATERARECLEQIRREKEQRRRAALVKVKCNSCHGMRGGGPGACRQCSGLGYLELERWKP